MAAKRWTIVDGPGKWDLAMGLFQGVQPIFTFVGPANQQIKVYVGIVVIKLEDTSLENFHFEGLFSRALGQRINPGVCKGFYTLRGRKGWVDIDFFSSR